MMCKVLTLDSDLSFLEEASLSVTLREALSGAGTQSKMARKSHGKSHEIHGKSWEKPMILSLKIKYNPYANKMVLVYKNLLKSEWFWTRAVMLVYIYIFQHHGSHIGVDKIWYLLIHCWDSLWFSRIPKRIAPKDRHSRIASPLNVQWLWQSISSDVFLRCPNGHLKILKQNLQMTAVACCGSTTIYKRCVDVSRRGHRGKNLSIRAAFAPSLAPSVPAK